MKKLTSKKYRICLSTYFDKNFEEMGKLCLKSMQVYAKKFDMDIKLFNNLKTSRPAPWNKIIIVQKLLKDYDFVFWIDSDAVFVNFKEDIRKEIENGKDFYLVKHHLKGRDVPNTGSFLLRNSDWSKKFLSSVWNKKEYIYHHYWENAAVMDYIGYEDVIVYNKYKLMIEGILYKLKIKKFTTKFLNYLGINAILFKLFNKPTKKTEERHAEKARKVYKEIKWLDLKWNSIPGVAESKNPVIHHYPSTPYDYRIKQMTLDLQKIKLI